jgi:hypothetical protein
MPFNLVYIFLAVSSAIFLLMGPVLATAGFSPSEQFLSRDFSFRPDGREGDRGKREKKKRKGPGQKTGCSVQTEKEGRRKKVGGKKGQADVLIL